MANCSNIPVPSEEGGSLTCVQLESALLELRVICNELNALSAGRRYAWYEGGDDFRVYATYDPFAAGYTENGPGDYTFAVTAGEDIDRIEFVHRETGGSINVTGGGQTIINIDTSANGGNTTALNGTKAIGAWYDGLNSNAKNTMTLPLSGALQIQHAWAAGVVTLTIPSVNTINDGSAVAITNLSQKF